MSDLVKQFEGFSAIAYKCPAGVWTIGYGTTRYPDGVRVKASDPECTKNQAERWLMYEVLRCELIALKYCKPLLTENQRKALASFIYNVGAGAFKASTLRKRINDLNFEDVPRQFRRWNIAGGRILPGLIRRREAEIALWLKDD